MHVSAISPLWIHCYKNIKDFKKVKKCIQILIGSFRQLKGRCKLCEQTVFTLEHILFDCYSLDISRSRLWNDVVNSGPKKLVHEIEEMNIVDKCNFILNGFNMPYNGEWSNLYCTFINFVYIFLIQKT